MAVLGHVKVLQQEAALAVAEASHALDVGGHVETDGLIKRDGTREVARRHEGFDLDGVEVWHGACGIGPSPRARAQSCSWSCVVNGILQLHAKHAVTFCGAGACCAKAARRRAIPCEAAGSAGQYANSAAPFPPSSAASLSALVKMLVVTFNR